MSTHSTWEEIVSSLEGSCKSLSEALVANDAEHLEDDMDFLGFLDSYIFQCDWCSWWYSVGEMSEESQVCNNCWEDYQDVPEYWQES